MRIAVDYLVKERRSGNYHYRRRVPKELREVIGKSELSRSLRTKDHSRAIQKYQAVHSEVERILRMASATETELDQYEADKKLLVKKGLIRRGADRFDVTEAEDQHAANAFHELSRDLHSRHSEAELEEMFANPSFGPRRLMQMAFKTGLQKPELRLRDAASAYLKERTDDYNAERQARDVERIVSALEEVIQQKNPPIVDVVPSDGYAFRDYWTDQGLAPETARRRLNTAHAVIEFAIRRFDIRNYNNPFSRIEVKGANQGAKQKRTALTVGEIHDLAPYIAKLNDEAQDIWTLMVLTGARPGELAMLTRDDVFLDEPVPHIYIQPNALWRKKTDSSQRKVPLIGKALDVCRNRLAQPDLGWPGRPLFPRYGKRRGPDGLSQVLVKAMKKAGVYETTRKVPYSVRHAHSDWLRRVTSQDRVDAIHGHSDGRVARVYGADEFLDLLRTDLDRALRHCGLREVGYLTIT